MRKHEFWHWTKDILDTNNHTVDVRMLGNSMYLTDDPENIKAIQDTEVRTRKRGLSLSTYKSLVYSICEIKGSA
jgi:hypothetical protein